MSFKWMFNTLEETALRKSVPAKENLFSIKQKAPDKADQVGYTVLQKKKKKYIGILAYIFKFC